MRLDLLHDKSKEREMNTQATTSKNGFYAGELFVVHVIFGTAFISLLRVLAFTGNDLNWGQLVTWFFGAYALVCSAFIMRAAKTWHLSAARRSLYGIALFLWILYVAFVGGYSYVLP